MVSHAGVILTLIMSPAAILLVVFAFFQKVGDGHRFHLRVYVPQSPEELSEKLWKRLQASAQIEKATALVTCTICLEDILPGQPVRRLRCGHLFHPDCICRWCCHKGDWAVACPMCRDREPLDTTVCVARGFSWSCPGFNTSAATTTPVGF
ncbi:HIP1 [Symbiodinium necroappetens]|uniref:HIP1 protein n=1 Tax=Symbiodinium necroappetens TaxID=1628268 RepID=A0A812UTA5_9DINO|nr:HIP1 [Symbiodinium necroappetens]